MSNPMVLTFEDWMCERHTVLTTADELAAVRRLEETSRDAAGAFNRAQRVENIEISDERNPTVEFERCTDGIWRWPPRRPVSLYSAIARWLCRCTQPIRVDETQTMRSTN